MDETKNVARLQKLINNFKSKFPPAEDEASSSYLLTTEEIIELISKHDPWCDFASIDLVRILEESGYKSEVIEEDNEIGFRWLISTQ
jgi:hypothetical protein